MITDNILSTKHKQPKIHQNAYINPYAMVIGDVTIHSGVSLWPGVIIRGDENWVEIKANTIVLDRSIITAQPDNPVYIGCNVLVSHDVNLFGCVIHDNVLKSSR